MFSYIELGLNVTYTFFLLLIDNLELKDSLPLPAFKKELFNETVHWSEIGYPLLPKIY